MEQGNERGRRGDVVGALDRKLARDLMRLRGQVMTIGLVVACGVASYNAKTPSSR